MSYPQPDKSFFGRLRDRTARRLANAAMWIATPWYRRMIEGLIIYGMDAAKDQKGKNDD